MRNICCGNRRNQGDRRRHILMRMRFCLKDLKGLGFRVFDESWKDHLLLLSCLYENVVYLTITDFVEKNAYFHSDVGQCTNFDWVRHGTKNHLV